MNLRIAAAFALLACATVAAADPTLEQRARAVFSDEEWSIIKELLDAERSKVLAEVRGELADATPAEPATASERVAASPAMGAWYAVPLGKPASDEREKRAVAAETSSDAVTPDAIAVGVTPQALSGAAGVAPADRGARGPDSTVQLNASAEAANASINVVIPGNRDLVGDRIVDRQWSLTASAPLDKDKGYASFASLDGAAKGLSVGAEWSRSSAKAFKFGETMKDFCKAIDLQGSCNYNAIEARLKKLDDPERSAKWHDFLARFGWTRILSFGATVTHQRYDYLQSLTAKPTTERQQQWSASGTYGMTSPERTTYFGAGFRFGRNYKEAGQRILCPQSDDEPFECVLGRFSPPRRLYSRVAHVEMRTVALGRPVSLRLEHDFAKDESSADLPIYLVRDKNSNFTGGLRLGWTTTDDFIAGIFVGKEFRVDGK